VTRRRGRRRKKLLDDVKDRRGYSHLKEEALDRTMWRKRFGIGAGPVVRQNTEWMFRTSRKSNYRNVKLRTLIASNTKVKRDKCVQCGHNFDGNRALQCNCLLIESFVEKFYR
jgi:hypothetical protein